MTALLVSGVKAADAAARRQEAIAARRDALQQLREGQIDFPGLVAIAAVDPDVANLRIAAVLASIGWNSIRIEEALLKTAIRPTRRIRWLLTKHGARHVEALYDVVAYRGRPNLDPGWMYR